MTIEEFNALSLSRKAALVWEWGYYISNFKKEDHNLAIFSYEKFFTEIKISADDHLTLAIEAIKKEQLPAELNHWLVALLSKDEQSVSIELDKDKEENGE